MITRVSDKYYIMIAENKPFQECDGKAVRDRPEYDLFVYRADSGWKVLEGMSGSWIGEGGISKTAVAESLRKLDYILESKGPEHFAQCIARSINRLGLSPRYKLADGLTKEQVTATMCLTSETAGTKKEKPVPRKAKDQSELPDAPGAIATVPPPQSIQGQLEVTPDANIMTVEDALRIESNIEKSASNIGKYILQLYRGRAYLIRGFKTWDEYYASITGKSKATAYRYVDESIQKEKLLEMGVPSTFNQKQISALKPVIEMGKDVVVEVLKDAKKIVNNSGSDKSKTEYTSTGVLPASAIKAAVEKVVPPALKTDPTHTDVTGQVAPPASVDVTDAQIDTKAPGDPSQSASPGEAAEVHLLHFAACTWHTDPIADVPTGCLKVETKEGGYVLVPYSAIYEMYNSWPSEFMDDAGNVIQPE